MKDHSQEEVLDKQVVKPLQCDVYAYTEDGDILFTHAWRRLGDPKRKTGKIIIGAGESAVPIQYHLHDKTTPKEHLAFLNPGSAAMWVDLNDCPTQAGDGGQISFEPGSNGNILRISDANTGSPCTLHYMLRFASGQDGAGPVYEYDPEIRNGGGGSIL